jgi:RES domain-containing protein
LPSLWRISKHIDLSGEGGMRANNRWNRKGRPVVYFSETISSVLLESLVHLWDDEISREVLDLIHVEYPGDLEFEEVDESQLPHDWPKNSEITRNIGDSWLQRCKAALLIVPSAIAPSTQNFLLNPQHPQAGLVTIRNHVRFNLDPRLKRLADQVVPSGSSVRSAG